MMYKAVMKPAFPAVVMEMPTCCSVSAAPRTRPHQAPPMRVMRFQLLQNRRIGPVCPFIGKQQDDGNQDDDGDDIAGGAEGKRADIVHANALGDEGSAPDEGRNEQQYRAFSL